jgi:hypothetical protein
MVPNGEAAPAPAVREVPAPSNGRVPECRPRQGLSRERPDGAPEPEAAPALNVRQLLCSGGQCCCEGLREELAVIRADLSQLELENMRSSPPGGSRRGLNLAELEPLSDLLIEDEAAEHLTQAHVRDGPEGWARFAAQHVAPGRLVCTDVSRRKARWCLEGPGGAVQVSDTGLRRFGPLFFGAIHDLFAQRAAVEAMLLASQLTEEEGGPGARRICEIHSYSAAATEWAQGRSLDSPAFKRFCRALCAAVARQVAR